MITMRVKEKAAFALSRIKPGRNAQTEGGAA
jgi:hypothetical protein